MINITEDEDKLILNDDEQGKSIIITKLNDDYIINYHSKDKVKNSGLIVDNSDEELYELIKSFFNKTYKDIINGNPNHKNKLYGIELGSQPYISYPSDFNYSEFKIIKLNHIGYKLTVNEDFVVIRDNSFYEIKDNYVELFNDISSMSKKVK